MASGLNLQDGLGSFRSVKLLCRLGFLIALPLLGGCETYTELRVTNPRGELICDWVARGLVWPVEEGYRITAVQRRDGRPYPETTRYPDGWRTTVVGPYIHKTHCAKPAWLNTTACGGK